MSYWNVNEVKSFDKTTSPISITRATGDNTTHVATTEFVQTELEAIVSEAQTVSGAWDFTGGITKDSDDLLGEAEINSLITTAVDDLEDSLEDTIEASAITTYTATFNWDGASGVVSNLKGITAVSYISIGYFQVTMDDIDGDYIVLIQEIEGLQGFYASREQANKSGTGFRFHVRSFDDNGHYGSQCQFDILVVKL